MEDNNTLQDTSVPDNPIEKNSNPEGLTTIIPTPNDPPVNHSIVESPKKKRIFIIITVITGLAILLIGGWLACNMLISNNSNEQDSPNDDSGQNNGITVNPPDDDDKSVTGDYGWFDLVQHDGFATFTSKNFNVSIDLPSHWSIVDQSNPQEGGMRHYLEIFNPANQRVAAWDENPNSYSLTPPEELACLDQFGEPFSPVTVTYQLMTPTAIPGLNVVKVVIQNTSSSTGLLRISSFSEFDKPFQECPDGGFEARLNDPNLPNLIPPINDAIYKLSIYPLYNTSSDDLVSVFASLRRAE